MYAVDHRNPSGPTLTGSDELRLYQAWRGSNKFFLQGRLIFGPDLRVLGLTVFLIVAPMSVFCVFIARKLLDDFANNWGVSIMVFAILLTFFDLVLLLLTSGRDPGIIPRNSHPPELEVTDGNGEVVQTPQLRLPRFREVVVNGTVVKVKYCDTCMLYRPPRCSHCSICNNCVEKFDHHCPWVGQCIALRNYRFFFMFVLTTTLLCVYVFGFCWIYITRIMDSEGTSIWKAIICAPASIPLIIYTFVVIWFVGGLTGYHLYLISRNQTTWENFRDRYDRRANPFNKGVLENFKEVFCSCIPQSNIKFRAKVPRETSVLVRAGSAGLVNPNMSRAIGEIEVGRKGMWGEMEPSGSMENKNSSSTESITLSRTTVDETDRIIEIHSRDRRPSWGRSGNWEMSPEIVTMASRIGEARRWDDPVNV